MGGQRIVDVQAGFADGLNTVSDPSALGPSQARQLTNSALTAYGSAQRRGGTQKVSLATPTGSVGLGNGVTGGIWWPSQGYYVVTTLANVYVSNGSAIPMTWSPVTGLVQSVAPVFRIFTGSGGAETLYMANSNHLASIAIGNTFTDLLLTPAVDGIEVYNNRLWGWSHGSNALYFSNLASAAGSIGGDSLGVGASSGGQINIVTFGASNIYTCAVIGNSLLIFHNRGISRLTGFGLSDITVQPQSVTPNFSLVGPWALATYNGLGWAVGYQGLAIVTENGVQMVGTPSKPDPLPAAIAQLTTLGISFALIRTAYDPVTQSILINIPTIGCYAYNTILGSFSGPWTGTYLTSGFGLGGVFIDFPGNTALIQPSVLFSDEAGWIYQTNTNVGGAYLDAVAADGTGGSAYSQIVQCRRLFGQSPLEPGGARAYAKSWRWANVLAQLSGSGTAPVITLSSQYGGSSTFTVSPVANVQQPYYVPAGGVGPYLDVTITDQGSGASEYAMVEVEGFYLGQR